MDGTQSEFDMRLKMDDVTKTSIRIYIVANNHFIRRGLANVLQNYNFHVAGAFPDISALRDAAIEALPGSVVLLDFPEAFDDVRGDLDDLRRRHPAARLVVLTSHDDRDSFLDCLSGEIDGYLLKSISAEVLIESLRLIVLGEKVFPALLAEWVLDSRMRSPLTSATPSVVEVDLSKREIDILECLSEGYSNKKIARLLNISDATVKVHVKNVLRKISATNRTEAAVWALTTGICQKASAARRAGGERAKGGSKGSMARETARLAVVHSD